MRPSSRTPEGVPNRCPVCGRRARIEPSVPPGDAPCPHCGHLLWFDGPTPGQEESPAGAAPAGRPVERLRPDPDVTAWSANAILCGALIGLTDRSPASGVAWAAMAL